MTDEAERAELLAALHASGAASSEDEAELAVLLTENPSLAHLVRDFGDSIVALASSFEPIVASPNTLSKIQAKIEGDGFLARLRRVFRK
ncbi:MAG: hypothetical protein WBG86_09290 [Polyangiales bacterium]